MILINDLKYAIRLLCKRPGFTILTTLVMAVGIGLSVYLFSFLNTMIFKALPFEDGESLVKFSASENRLRKDGRLYLQDYYEIRESLKGVSEFGAYKYLSLNVSGRDGVRQYNAASAEPNIFQLTRTKPILGRVFTNVENRKGAERVVVIGFDMWKSQFGGDSKVIDQNLRINGVGHRIIGVMPEGYLFPSNVEMWVPMRKDPMELTRKNSRKVWGLGHLDEGVSISEVDRQLAVIMQRIQERYPDTNSGISAYVDTIPMSIVEDGIAVVYSLQVVAILILFLAAINVSNLLLSRAIERRKETAIRVALGAPRSRLIGQMLWESIIICSVGGVIGLLVMAWGLEITETITASFSVDKPTFWFKFGVDAFTIKLFLLFLFFTIVVTGLFPAWKNSGSDFNAVLRDGTRGALGKKSGRLNRFLVISEIFLSIPVLIAAATIVLVSYAATHADNGAETKNILTARVLLTYPKYDNLEKKEQFAKTLQSRLENNMGIGKVAIASVLPGQNSSSRTFELEGHEYTTGKQESYPEANYIVVMPGSLSKLSIELYEGRYFNTSDDGLDKGSIIVTESFAVRHFSSQSPLGSRLRIVGGEEADDDWLTIVGVVEHTNQGRVNTLSGNMPSIFRPYSQAPRNMLTLAMEMKADRSEVVSALRKILASVDPELPASRIALYTENLKRREAPLTFISNVFALFGLAAAVLAASGIYGVMSNTVNQRTQEIGVKRALGAEEQHVAKEFLWSGFTLLLWGGIPGVAVGCAMGFAMSKVMGASSGDLLIITIAITSAIGSVVMLATYFPTLRALKLEPSEALHYE